MTLQQILDFIAVSQEGSLHAAARVTGQTQPGLSKSLRRLEESVGAALLARSAKGVRLTPFGEGFLGHARLIAAEAQRAKGTIAQLRGDAHAEVRFGISPMSSVLLAAPAVAALRKNRPDTKLFSSSGMYHVLAPLLREGRIDFAVCPPPASPAADFLETQLIETPVVVVARPGHPLARSTSLKSLSGASFVMGAPQGIAGSGVQGAFLRADLPLPKIDIQTDSLIDTLTMVSGTDQLALMPAMLLQSPLLRNTLAILPLTDTLDNLRISLIVRRDSPLSPAAGALAALFEREGVYLMSSFLKAQGKG